MSDDVPVLVVSREQMVRDAVRAALQSEGFLARSLGAPLDRSLLREVRQTLDSDLPVIGVYLTELDRPEQLCEAAAVVGHRELTWLVLTSTEPGPAWGAVVEAGAHGILSKDASLHRVAEEIRTAGHGGPFVDQRFDEALTTWHQAAPERRAQVRRLEGLSLREMTTLLELDAGSTTDEIAAHGQTSVGTVRARLRTISRKLQVGSRGEAVSRYRDISRWLAG